MLLRQRFESYKVTSNEGRTMDNGKGEESMINKLSKAVLIAFILVLAVFAGPALAQTGEQAQVRVAHLSPDATNVDVYVNGEPVAGLKNVAFKTVSEYLALPAGTQNIEIYSAGQSSDPILQTNVELQSGAAYTVGVVGLISDDSIATKVYNDEVSIPASGKAKLRVIHAAPDVGSVDIAPEDGPELFTALGFPNATKYVEVPVGKYTLEARAEGTNQVVFTAPDVSLVDGTVYSAFAVGKVGDNSIDIVLTDDASDAARQKVGDTVPGTGGLSPVVLSLVGVLLLVGGLALHALRRRVFTKHGIQ